MPKAVAAAIGLLSIAAAVVASAEPPAGAVSCSGCHPASSTVTSAVPRLAGQAGIESAGAVTRCRAGTEPALRREGIDRLVAVVVLAVAHFRVPGEPRRVLVLAVAGPQGEAGLVPRVEAITIDVDAHPLLAALHVDYSILQRGRLAFGPLAGASVERLAVQGRGSDRDASTSVVVPRVSLGLRATWRLTGTGDELQRGLRLVLDGVGSLAPGSTTLVVRHAQEQLELWSVPVLGAMARVGVSWRF